MSEEAGDWRRLLLMQKTQLHLFDYSHLSVARGPTTSSVSNIPEIQIKIEAFVFWGDDVWMLFFIVREGFVLG